MMPNAFFFPNFSASPLFFRENKYRQGLQGLRGPAAILFIKGDTCSDSIAKLFRACFVGYRTLVARYVAKCGIAQIVHA